MQVPGDSLETKAVSSGTAEMGLWRVRGEEKQGWKRMVVMEIQSRCREEQLKSVKC